MKYFFLAYILTAVGVVSWAGFRGEKSVRPPLEILPDMDHQAKIRPQMASEFFADGMGSRLPVKGTLPIGFEIPELAMQKNGKPSEFGFSQGHDYYNTGKFGDYFGHGMPEEVKVDAALIERGRQRYNINCTVCHGASGNGKGVTVNYSVANAANFLSDDFVNADGPNFRPDGSIFDTISHGKGLMGSYGANITLQDRWAIVAYLRTLQAAAKAAGVKG